MDSKLAARDILKHTHLDYQSDRHQDEHRDASDKNTQRTNYSGFRRWEQRMRDWKRDVDAIRKWSQEEPITSPPPDVSLLLASKCDCQDQSHEVCGRLRSYRAAVEDFKASLESETMEIEAEEGTTKKGVEPLEQKIQKCDDDDDDVKAASTKDVMMNKVQLASIVLKEVEEMLLLATAISNRFDAIFLTLWDIGTYQNQENYVAFDSNPIATNPGKISFADLVPPAPATAAPDSETGASQPSSSTTATPTNSLLLLPFQSFLHDLFHIAKEIDQTDESCEEKLQQTAAMILEWTPSTKPLDPNTVVYIPSEAVEHPHLSRMILYAMIYKTAIILGRDVGLTLDQQAGLIADDNSVMSTPSIHMVVNHVAQRLTEVVPHVHEVKVKIDDLVAISDTTVPETTSVKKVVRGLADNFLEALQFGGMGVNRNYRGALLSRVSVEILELELEHVGTTKAQLHFRRSGAYPLLDEETTNLFLKAGTNNNEDSAMTQFKGILVDSDPTKGLEILATLISYSDFERAGVPEGKIELVNAGDTGATELVSLVGYLGARKSQNVYKLQEDKLYLKVPKAFEFVGALEKEMKTLRAMDHPCIAKVNAQGLDHLKVSMRCDTSELRCMRMEGLIGVSTLGFYFRDLDAITFVCERVMDALDHAHSRKIAHLKVSPMTITVCQVTKDTIQVQMDDWGDAVDMESLLYSFNGPYLFSHEDLHHHWPGRSWHPTAEHDLASVAYSMATLVSRLERHRDPTIDTKVDRSRNVVEKHLTKLGIDAVARTKLMNALLPIKKNDRTREIMHPNFNYGGMFPNLHFLR